MSELVDVFRYLAVPVALALGLLACPARAQESDNQAWDGGFDLKAERRSNVVLGFSGGLVMGGASGYPNEIAKLGDPAYEAKTGFGVGPGGAFWIGGALTDWFSVGVGGMLLGVHGKSGDGSGGAFILRVEAFPLYLEGGGLRDLAFFAVFGAGGYTVHGEMGRRGEGGFTSVAGLGSAYELFRFGPISIGPNAEYELMRSQSATAHQVTLGARVLYYGGPG